MTREELLNRLTGPQPPEPVSAWPPGPGWWVLFLAVAVLLLFGVRYHRRIPPFWRLPGCWIAQRRYLRRLTTLPEQSEPSVALSQWLRQLARDGLGVSPTLPPSQWVRALESALGEPTPGPVRDCLYAIYRPGDIRPVIADQQLTLRALCLRCLHLRSPGPRA